MTNRRMITSDYWLDDLIGRLTFFERLVFLGLITCVDDQGRMLNNPIILIAHAFPYDSNVKPEQVTSALEKIARSGKVMAYEAEGYPLLQLVNWWKHQSPAWASPSKFPAPPGWTDRVRMHTSANKVLTENWENPGGFLPTSLPTPLPTLLPTSLPRPIDEVNGEVKGDIESEGEDEGEGYDDVSSHPSVRLSVAFEKAAGILMHNPQRWGSAIDSLLKQGVTPEDIPLILAQLSGKYHVAGPWSIENAAAIYMGQKRSPRKDAPSRPDPFGAAIQAAQDKLNGRPN